MNYRKQNLKANTCGVSQSTPYKGGMKAKTYYNNTSEHSGHSEMTWQLSNGQSLMEDI